MRYNLSIFLFLCTIILALTYADFEPCRGKARIDENCDTSNDCEGTGIICVKGKCRCHHFYETITDKKKRKSCKKLPDKIGASCSGKCRDPLFCRSGKCKCVLRGTSKIIDNECVVEAALYSPCGSHADCSKPFSACIGGKCKCIAGSSRTRHGSCAAGPHCPLGGKPVKNKKCTRFTDNQQVINNLVNSGSRSDDCPKNNFCVTPEGSPVGHCCKATCPLNTTPDDRYSCEPGDKNPCPSDTHICNRVSGPGYAFATCCKRPCDANGPEAVFVKGSCYPRGYKDGPCTRHEECDGFATMQCNRNRCACKGGFVGKSDLFTSIRKNPSQQCQKKCSADLGRDVDCYSRASLGKQCFIQEQCPNNAGCYRGKCRCKCGYLTQGGGCTPPPKPVTRQPGTGSGLESLLPSGTGNDGGIPKIDVDKIGEFFQNFLKGIGGGGRT